nr:hypothetical protein [Orrella marina]
MTQVMRDCELAIVGGTVIDGTGAPRRLANVYVSDGRIVGIGSSQEGGRPLRV